MTVSDASEKFVSCSDKTVNNRFRHGLSGINNSTRTWKHNWSQGTRSQKVGNTDSSWCLWFIICVIYMKMIYMSDRENNYCLSESAVEQKRWLMQSTDRQAVQLMAMHHCSEGRKLHILAIDLMNSLSHLCHHTKIVLLHSMCVYSACVCIQVILKESHWIWSVQRPA